MEKVLDYLEAEWTIMEILNLEQKVNDLLNRISQYPKICPQTDLLIKTITSFTEFDQKRISLKSLILEEPNKNRYSKYMN